MATGTPVNKQKQSTRSREKAPSVELSYPNKRSVSEILLTPPGEYGLCHNTLDIKRLYFAENLAALAALARDPKVCGQVRLVYIDPPYATQTAFQSRTLAHAYEDVFETTDY